MPLCLVQLDPSYNDPVQPKVWLSLLFVFSMPRQEGRAAPITKFQENIRTLLHVTAISCPSSIG